MSIVKQFDWPNQLTICSIEISKPQKHKSKIKRDRDREMIQGLIRSEIKASGSAPLKFRRLEANTAGRRVVSAFGRIKEMAVPAFLLGCAHFHMYFYSHHICIYMCIPLLTKWPKNIVLLLWKRLFPSYPTSFFYKEYPFAEREREREGFLSFLIR